MAQGASEDIRADFREPPSRYYIHGSETLEAIRQSEGGYALFDTANGNRAIFECGQKYDWIFGRYRWSEHATPVVVVRSGDVFILVDAETGEEIVHSGGSSWIGHSNIFYWFKSYPDEEPFLWRDGDVSGTLSKIPIRVDYPSGLAGDLNVSFRYHSDPRTWSSLSPNDLRVNIVFCDREGNVVPKEALPFDAVGDFSRGVAIAVKDGRYGVIDTSVNLVLPYEYDYIERKRYGYGYFRLHKNPIIKWRRWNDSPRRPVEAAQDMVGVATIGGEVVVPCEYNNVSIEDYRMADGTDKTVFIVRTTAEDDTSICGLLDSRGGEILPAKYADIRIDYYGGWCVVQDSASGRFGTVDVTDGRPVIPAVYDEISIEHSPNGGVVCFVRKGRKWGCLDGAGKRVLPLIYDKVERYSDAGNGSILVLFRGEWMRVDRRNQLIERYEKYPVELEVLTFDMPDL